MIHFHLNLIPSGNETSISGYLFLVFDNKELNEKLESELKLITDDLYALLNRYERITGANNKAVKYEYLYKAISSLHSSMNSKTILQEVHTIIKEEYPDVECLFYLIKDISGSEELPTKELSYENNSDREICLRTLILEEVQVEKLPEMNKVEVYLPLKGKQGVYGVLQLTALSAVVFPKEEIEFLTTLAYTAGNAMENAELYQQSRQMIADLQLINEASHSLNLNLRMNEITTFMKQLFHKTFNACEVGFINFISETEELQILEGSTMYFHTIEGKSMANVLSSRINHQREALFISDSSEESGCSFPA